MILRKSFHQIKSVVSLHMKDKNAPFSVRRIPIVNVKANCLSRYIFYSCSMLAETIGSRNYLNIHFPLNVFCLNMYWDSTFCLEIDTAPGA